MATPCALLGPPELYISLITRAAAVALAPPVDPFMDAMVSNFNKFASGNQYGPPMGRTENNSATYLSSGNPCLDFFFHVVPDTPSQSLGERIALAWANDPLTTLKLTCNLRGVRGTGKSDKEGFYTAALWLFKNHPRTLGCNVGEFAEFGYYKDLPEILYRLLEGPDVRRIQKADWEKSKGGRLLEQQRLAMRHGVYCGNTNSRKKSRKSKSSIPREDRMAAAMARSKQEEEKARSIRLEKNIASAKKLLDRYSKDGDFRYLHDNISDHFSQRLKADIGFLKSGEINKISLAAKWCPSLYSSFDRSTLLCESIARRMYPRESYPEYEGIEDAHYAYRVRDRMRKEVLVPLRKVLELPEVYMGANDWGSIPYNRVASVAMRRSKEIFMKHDKKRFVEYLMNVKSGKTTIAAGALLPHEIISTFIYRYGRYYFTDYSYGEDGSDNNDTEDEVAKLQWKRMVDDLLKAGKLENCIAVCDVSGSMNGLPMEVSIALGILVSELSKDPWKGKVITFSENPQLHLIQGDDLAAKAQFVRNMEWGANTDFQKVFDLLLEVAKEGKLSSDQMVKRLFVFSDMEFDEASANTWETDYQAIRRKFRTAGYEDGIPQIVFWNLRDSSSTPVCVSQDGVALVSGFSKNIMKVFLNNNGSINPDSVMLDMISGDEYQKLVVID